MCPRLVKRKIKWNFQIENQMILPVHNYAKNLIPKKLLNLDKWQVIHFLHCPDLLCFIDKRYSIVHTKPVGHTTKTIELEPVWSLIQNDPFLSSSVKIILWRQQKIPNGQMCWLFIAYTKIEGENEISLINDSSQSSLGLKSLDKWISKLELLEFTWQMF